MAKDGGIGGPAALQAAEAVLLALASDVRLTLERDGTVADVAVAEAELIADGAASWRGRRLADLVTVESRPKIAELVADAAAGRPPRWRQVNHVTPNGEVPVRYACAVAGDRLVAIGRDLRTTAAAQQRLLQAQQALERDYLRLRQAEARYRLMFDAAQEAVVIVDLAGRRISEANPAAHRLLDVAPGSLPRQPATALVADEARDDLLELIGAAAVGSGASRRLKLAGGGREATVALTPFRQDRAGFLLVRLETEQARSDGADDALGAVVEQMPDAFVLVDDGLRIISANAAFLALVQAPSADALVGDALDRWIGRPGVELDLIGVELRKNGVVRNVATVVRGVLGGQEEVELSAVAVGEGTERRIGFVVRGVARRLRDLPPGERELPRSVDQLTNLVGRMSLREIVRESSDLIERLCIEAALDYTSDNRASAAEILGLSRQGLYSKLHRHGLGNLVSGED